MFFEWDLEMYDAQLNEHAKANTSDLNEELGQVRIHIDRIEQEKISLESLLPWSCVELFIGYWERQRHSN